MANDEKMIQAYKDGKDLYAEVASLAFNKPYLECQEPDKGGTAGREGSERRGQAKAIVLGICYGKEVPSIATDLGITKQVAQQVYDRVMTALPNLKQFMLDSQQMARDKGYVTTFWGRKRRLPNMQLDDYEFKFESINSDPLNFEDDQEFYDYNIAEKYINWLNNCRSFKEKENIKAKAKSEGISIKDNGGYIADATRQCVNSRIQGSAGDMIKIAILIVGKNERLKELGFKLLLTVHDELIGECPIENISECKELFINCMLEAASELDIPFKCDAEITKCWYGEPIKI